MNGLENLVQDRCQAASLVDTEEFKSQLAEMKTQVAKLDEKPVRGELPKSVVRGNTEPENRMRRYLLTYPKRKESKKRKLARHQGRQRLKKKLMSNNNEMQC
uniref:Uncharacterized protein n=1 Tax=Solanum tuberosum TaxID=4113 RepID=M1DU70_SOLTU